MQAPYLGVRIEAWASEGKPVVGEVGEMVTAPLFVVLAAGRELTEELTLRLRTAIRQQVSRRHVPDDIVETVSIPMTLTGKKLEVPIKRLLQLVATARRSTQPRWPTPRSLTGT